jgi:hydrogenase expression/formation protein HypE
MLEVSRTIRCLRDPTRGGLATTLNELARQSNVGIRIYEDAIPVDEAVRGACEMLGFDPLYVANEGKLIAIVNADESDIIIDAIKKDKYGQDAAVIGEVTEDHRARVTMKTAIGATRIVDMLTGELLPRIC